MKTLHIWIIACSWSASAVCTLAFAPVQPPNRRHVVVVVDNDPASRSTGIGMAPRLPPTMALRSSSSSTGNGNSNGYVPPEQSVTEAQTKKQPLLPKAGDLVRYYDLDGGDAKGQVLIGRISFISQRILSPEKNKNGKTAAAAWTAELTELEDVGDGYYAEYGSRQRQWKKAVRDLANIAPVSGSYVRSENAYKVPVNRETGLPIVRAEHYDLEAYPGPFGTPETAINQDVVQADGILYDALKGRLFRYAALAGLTGTLIADLTKGTEFAVIYGAGFAASLVYLYLLSLKTDTLAAAGTSSGPMTGFAQRISNFRFGMPIVVLLGVALYNQSLGDANPVGTSNNFLVSVTSQQFAAAVVGFLTYRLPLFVVQIQSAFETDGGSDGGVTLPGSAGLALQMVAQDSPVDALPTAASLETLPTVLLISGPQATGRSELVEQLVASDDRFIKPSYVDKVVDGAAFERLEQRNEFLAVQDGRYGLTAANVIASAKRATESGSKVVVVDANVGLAKQLVKIGGIRLVGVWVGLDTVKDFEERLKADIANGNIVVPDDETPESVTRARIKEIVKEIEYGLSSGIFEFTVLNRDPADSVKQLKEAGSYCLK